MNSILTVRTPSIKTATYLIILLLMLHGYFYILFINIQKIHKRLAL